MSRRRNENYVRINCAAIPETLLESELFGHEKGAFTGAIKQKLGRVEEADGGTIFLDEIADMGKPLQAKLLRFLEDGTFTRVGGTEELRVNVRLVAATTKTLRTAGLHLLDAAADLGAVHSGHAVIEHHRVVLLVPGELDRRRAVGRRIRRPALVGQELCHVLASPSVVIDDEDVLAVGCMWKSSY